MHPSFPTPPIGIVYSGHVDSVGGGIVDRSSSRDGHDELRILRNEMVKYPSLLKSTTSQTIQRECGD